MKLETKVGLFLLFGVGIICTLIICFGEMPDLFKPTYKLIVQFPDASGLLKGSDVFLSGAVIGKVTSDPQTVPDADYVQVDLKINSDVKLRTDAKYVIGSSGLLGDRFVDVQPAKYPEGTPDSQKAPYEKDGDLIRGRETIGLDAVLDSSKPLIDRANDIAAQLDDMITRLNRDVLPSTSTEELKETIFKLRDMVDNGDSMVKNANDLLSQAKEGKGALGRLINDKKVADNLAAFIANLKAHGPVFYKDDTAEQKDDDGPRKKN